MATNFIWDGTSNAWASDHWGRGGVAPKWPGDSGSTADDTVTINTTSGGTAPTSGPASSLSIGGYVCEGNNFGHSTIGDGSDSATKHLTVSGPMTCGALGSTDRCDWWGLQGGGAATINGSVTIGRIVFGDDAMGLVLNDLAVLGAAGQCGASPEAYATIRNTAYVLQGGLFGGNVICDAQWTTGDPVNPACIDLSAAQVGYNIYLWTTATGVIDPGNAVLFWPANMPSAADVRHGTRYDSDQTGSYDPMAAAVFPPPADVSTVVTAYGPTGAEHAGTCVVPAASDVRHGVAVRGGTGTCCVPAAASVACGVAVDATTGSAVLTPQNVADALKLAPAAGDPATGSAMAGLADKTGFKLAADGLDAISTTPPAGAAANFREMCIQLWRRFFKKAVLTGGALQTFADDGTTVVTTQTAGSDGTTETQGAAS
jgi:hypothetical protein